MGLVTSDTAKGVSMENGTNITVTEPVYAVVEGRTILAAAVGDELSPAEAERLQVGKNGKSSNGIGPATSLEPGPEAQLPGAVGLGEAGENEQAPDADADADAFDPSTATGAQLDERYEGVEGYKKSASVADRQAWAAKYEAAKAGEGA